MKHFFAFICCMLLSAVSQAQSEQFSVKVMDADNEPVVGAHVIYTFPYDPANETFTDEEGVFTGLTVWGGKRYYIVAHPGYQTYYGTYLSDSPQQQILLSKAGEPLPQEGSKDISFRVVNQDGVPVAGAHVIANYRPELEAVVGDDGLYSAKVNDYGIFSLIVFAPEYETYHDVFSYSWLPDGDNVVLVDKIGFKQGMPATIVLPVAPDPAWGKYYLPVRNAYVGTYPNGTFTLYLEREHSPQANIPYVIIPDADFELKPSDYDRKGSTPIDVSWPSGPKTHRFCGSYFHRNFMFTENLGVRIIDKTLDSEVRLLDGVRVGPFRAYFLFYGWSTAEMALVFEDEETGVAPKALPVAGSPAFDLQGRRLTAAPAKGIYIKDGRKQVVK